MLIVFRALNNIIAYKLLTACRRVPLDHYYYQTTIDFKKLLKQEDVKNISKIATPILLTIGMHIGSTRFLELGFPNAKYDLESKLREGCTDRDWGDNGEIEEAIAADNDENNDEEDF